MNFDLFLQGLETQGPDACTELMGCLERPEELPELATMIEEGADPQFAGYVDVQTRTLLFAMLLKSMGVDEGYGEVIDDLQEAYFPSYPPASPITDSFCYLASLLDYRLGPDQTTMGQMVLRIQQAIGVSGEELRRFERFQQARLGIFETISIESDRLKVRELVSDRTLLVHPPTEYLGTPGDLRFVRLAPPIDDSSDYYTELTTPYILQGISAERWTQYLRRLMPEIVVESDGAESTDLEERLAAAFRRNARLWMDFIGDGYLTYETEAIFLTGIPDDADSLPCIWSPPADDATVSIPLTPAQRKAAVEVMPDLEDRLALAKTTTQTISLPYEVWESLEEDARAQIMFSGRAATRLRNLSNAVREALDRVEHWETSGTSAEASKAVGIPGSQLETVYRLHISLDGSDPLIWRRIEVPDLDFADLHLVVQRAMGWEDCHLHEFIVGRRRFSPPNEYADAWGDGPEDSEDISVSDVAKTRKRKNVSFKYIYDFGDSWAHAITIETTGEPDPAAIYPRCLDGAGKCPPEDCGGIWGYSELLDAISEPSGSEVQERLEWFGGEFDPMEFDVTECTSAMRSLFENTSPAFQPEDFDIHAELFDEHNELNVEFFEWWRDQLSEKFETSPEFDQLPDGEYGIVHIFTDLCVSYLGESPVQLSKAELEQVLFELVPRKVMLAPADSGRTISELKAFFCFLHREFDLKDAGRLAECLDQAAERRFAKELGNSSNFGMGKSFLMAGRDAGFDMTSKSGIDAFVESPFNRLPPGTFSLPQDDPDEMGIAEPVVETIRRAEPRVGRNDLCPCGSGKKYKKCCLKEDKGSQL
ncbi:MAG: SEC-C domain-containing protein [Planctomycetaceae bacterium]|nr:SEC-C domain-containing protein [Planctomycetaceae bacterium]